MRGVTRRINKRKSKTGMQLSLLPSHLCPSISLLLSSFSAFFFSFSFSFSTPSTPHPTSPHLLHMLSLSPHSQPPVNMYYSTCFISSPQHHDLPSPSSLYLLLGGVSGCTWWHSAHPHLPSSFRYTSYPLSPVPLLLFSIGILPPLLLIIFLSFPPLQSPL